MAMCRGIFGGIFIKKKARVWTKSIACLGGAYGDAP